MGFDIFFYKYYAALSNPGLPRTLPFRPTYHIIYNKIQNSIIFIDNENNLW